MESVIIAKSSEQKRCWKEEKLETLSRKHNNETYSFTQEEPPKFSSRINIPARQISLFVWLRQISEMLKNLKYPCENL